MTTDSNHLHRPRAGRPTAQQAEQRHRDLLDQAMDMFLRQGFERTTMDAIAEAMHMTKRTIYSLYTNKEALFKAAIIQAIESNLVSLDTIKALETEDLEETLVAIARLWVDNYTSPRGIRLHRVINAEAFRFPELTWILFEKDSRQVVNYLRDLLSRHAAHGDLVIERPEATAALFLAIAVGSPARGILAGGGLTEAVDLDDYLRFCVRQFLNGVRRR